MKKRIINIISIVILIAIIVLAFVGKVSVKWKAYHNDSFYYQNSTWVDIKEGGISYTGFDAITSEWSRFTAITCIVIIWGGNTVLCLTSLLAKRKGKDPALHVVFPFLSLLPWGYFINICAYPIMWEETLKAKFGYPDIYNKLYSEIVYEDKNTISLFALIIIALWILYIILCFIKRSSVIVGNPTNEMSIEKKQPKVSTELEELKSLLDNGIITPEEFDAKKKQILGL